jgi:VIT1/CCC1 family predicted Fe2+/Mn2+ transporter
MRQTMSKNSSNDPFGEIKADIGCGIFVGFVMLLGGLIMVLPMASGDPLVMFVVLFFIAALCKGIFGK